MPLSIIILAAGKGTRMLSKMPKVLHKLAGTSLLARTVATAKQLNPNQIFVVYSDNKEELQKDLSDPTLIFSHQKDQLGTADAVKSAIPELNPNNQVLILLGDVPLISLNLLQELLALPKNDLNLITANFVNPFGLGRIVRDKDNNILSIVEEKDASLQQKNITEINTGIFLIPANKLPQWLDKIDNNNKAKEYYLTDIIQLSQADNVAINSVVATNNFEITGINTRKQLVSLERQYQEYLADNLLANGVTVVDPKRIDIRGSLISGVDCVLDVNNIFEGKVVLGDGCEVGPNSIIKNSQLGNKVKVLANTVIENAIIGDDCVVGPFARIRPGSVLQNNVKVGNFVELKNTTVDSCSKINHLSYIGDADIGKDVNIGAGTITCNYDGANKHKTIIKDKVFVGSNTEIVAPITLGHGATIAAGSTIIKNVPDNNLTMNKKEQHFKEDYKRPAKEE